MSECGFESYEDEIIKLSNLINDAKGSIVVFTGAGISTSASIPDYRGTNGLYVKKSNIMPLNEDQRINMLKTKTKIGNKKRAKKYAPKKKKTAVPQLRLPEATLATPTYTHMALKTLMDYGYQCHSCGSLLYRNFDVAELTGRSRHFTGRVCPHCIKDNECREKLDLTFHSTIDDCVQKYKFIDPSIDIMKIKKCAAEIMVRNYGQTECRIISGDSTCFQFLSNQIKAKIQRHFGSDKIEPDNFNRPPLLRDVVVHYFEKQPNEGLAEIYRVQSALEAIHSTPIMEIIRQFAADVPYISSEIFKRKWYQFQKSASWDSDWLKKLKAAHDIYRTDPNMLSTKRRKLDHSESNSHYVTPAKLIIVLGTSLTVLKNYKFLWPMGLGVCSKSKHKSLPEGSCSLVINTLQPTCKDGIASLVFRGPCDNLFRSLMQRGLGLEVPLYDPVDHDQLLKLAVPILKGEENTKTRADIPFQVTSS